ncbi:helix-turn-helix domain-containing protein [Gordonia sputi]
MSVWEDIMDTPAEAEDIRARAALLRAVRECIDAHSWSRTVAAAKLSIAQARLADLIDGRISTFSINELVALADRLGIHASVAAELDPSVGGPADRFAVPD